MNQIDKYAKTLWDYHKLNHKIIHADVILCLGNKEIDRCLERTLDLFSKQIAPLIIFSGGVSTDFTSGKKEADVLREKAINLGIPEEAILVENESKNTGENIMYTNKLLDKLRINIASIIVVTKGTMERRVYATFKKVWSNKNVEPMVTSPNITYEEYPNEEIFRKELINELISYTHRISEYALKGFQIQQEIPLEVENASERLKNLGYKGM